MIELNELLSKVGLPLDRVLIMRHRPTERPFADEQPDLYNAYQCCHRERVETALSKATHLVSFLGHQPRRALLVGVYMVKGWRELTGKKWRELETSKRLIELGDRGPNADRKIRFFELELGKELERWKGKLVVEWPGLERSWWRWANRNAMPIHAIHDESILISGMPPWNEVVLTWREVQAIPRSWRAILSQWRGIYIILDLASGKPYVGSAYGQDNLFARWQAYGSTGHGGNVDLKDRDPTQFQFAILERVSPDLPAEDVIRLEATWKDRLGSRRCGLNRN